MSRRPWRGPLAAAVLAVTLAGCGAGGAAPAGSAATPTSPPAAAPTPTATARSAGAPAPPAAPTTAAAARLAGRTVSFTIDVQQPLEREVPKGSTVTNLAGGGVRADSIRASDGSIYLMWKLDPKTLPAGAAVAEVETLVCGSGSGDFYEVYGPYGAEEIEYEVTPPAADGCWHFTRDSGTDYRVEVYVNDDSTMTIARIEYRITFR